MGSVPTYATYPRLFSCINGKLTLHGWEEYMLHAPGPDQIVIGLIKIGTVSAGK